MEASEILEAIRKNISVGDIIAIVVAIIAFFGVLVSNWRTNSTTKEISESNAKLQEKWNQKNIDANLIANARIEWIQKVRNNTAELLAQYYSIIKSIDLENNTYPDSIELEKTLLNSKEKTELLILFFGHEEDEMNLCKLSDYEKETILLKKTANDGKNDILVEFLSRLSDKFYLYYSDIKKQKYIKTYSNVEKAKLRMEENQTEIQVGEYNVEQPFRTLEGEIVTEYFSVPEYDVEYQNDDVLAFDEAEKELEHIKSNINSSLEDLGVLRDIMRTYLKIEWNIAKTGK